MIDWDRIAELEDEIGAEDFSEVVVLFLSEVEAELTALPSAMGDAIALRDRLHAMKGSALNLGFSAFATLCAQGETRAQAGDAFATDADAVAALYHRSKSAFLARSGLGATDIPDSSGDVTEIRTDDEAMRCRNAHPP